jgi:hypothetical protein
LSFWHVQSCCFRVHSSRIRDQMPTKINLRRSDLWQISPLSERIVVPGLTTHLGIGVHCAIANGLLGQLPGRQMKQTLYNASRISENSSGVSLPGWTPRTSLPKSTNLEVSAVAERGRGKRSIVILRSDDISTARVRLDYRYPA